MTESDRLQKLTAAKEEFRSIVYGYMKSWNFPELPDNSNIAHNEHNGNYNYSWGYDKSDGGVGNAALVTITEDELLSDNMASLALERAQSTCKAIVYVMNDDIQNGRRI